MKMGERDIRRISKAIMASSQVFTVTSGNLVEQFFVVTTKSVESILRAESKRGEKGKVGKHADR